MRARVLHGVGALTTITTTILHPKYRMAHLYALLLIANHDIAQSRHQSNRAIAADIF